MAVVKKKKTQPLPLGWVVIHCDDLGAALVARLSEQRPDVSAGYGGWTEIARPQRKSLAIWQGRPAWRMTLGILLDHVKARTGPGPPVAEMSSAETAISLLEKMALPLSSSVGPPTITLEARGGHVPHTEKVWVIDTLQWQDGAVANSKGNRVRQGATLGLMEWVGLTLVHSSPAQVKRDLNRAHHPKRGAASKRHTAQAKKPQLGTVARDDSTGFGLGEDLMTIAAAELGDPARWVEIAQLNGIRDPRSIAPGQVLRLP